MNYQLVVQLPVVNGIDYNLIIKIENDIIDKIKYLGIVDGHDAGSNEMNIFIHTDSPGEVFDILKTFIEDKCLLKYIKVAYRELNKSNYTILFPPGLKEFTVS